MWLHLLIWINFNLIMHKYSYPLCKVWDDITYPRLSFNGATFGAITHVLLSLLLPSLVCIPIISPIYWSRCEPSPGVELSKLHCVPGADGLFSLHAKGDRSTRRTSILQAKQHSYVLLLGVADLWEIINHMHTGFVYLQSYIGRA